MDWILSAGSLAVSLIVLFFVFKILKRISVTKKDEIVAALRQEFRLSREEGAHQARDLREEIANTQIKGNESLKQALTAWSATQKQDLTTLRENTEAKLESIRKTTEDRLAGGEKAQRQAATNLQESIQKLTETVRTEMTAQRERLQKQLSEIQQANEQRFEKVQRTVGEQLKELAESNRQDQHKSRETLNQKLMLLQESNEKKLDQMRQTVDEKLQSTLEKRLGQSFELVSKQLEAVQRGLGEMQNLATGVGDLKRVLTNVKDRGTWGEYQLQAILEQILTPDQYGSNIVTKPGGGPVEFAVKLPGKDGEGDNTPVWLPIDAKFPKEDYERLLDATQRAEPDEVSAASRALENAVKRSAKDIHDKYIEPPATTDFGILFLPTEGLYAEVLRQPGLHDTIQRNYRVLVAGPTTLAAILSSLRVGFQTLAIEKRAHEVWTVLAAVKTEFGKFGGVLDRLKRQINAASNTIDQSQTRTRAMQRKLRSVEALPAEEAETALSLPEDADILHEEESDTLDEKPVDTTPAEDNATL